MMVESSDHLTLATQNITALRSLDVSTVNSEINTMVDNVHRGVNALLRSEQAYKDFALYDTQMPDGTDYTNVNVPAAPPVAAYDHKRMQSISGTADVQRTTLANRLEIAFNATALPVRSEIAQLFNREYARVKTKVDSNRAAAETVRKGDDACAKYVGTPPQIEATDELSRMTQQHLRRMAAQINPLLENRRARDQFAIINPHLSGFHPPFDLEGGDHFKINIPAGELPLAQQNQFLNRISRGVRLIINEPTLEIREELSTTFVSLTETHEANVKKGARPTMNWHGLRVPDLSSPAGWLHAIRGAPDGGYGDDEGDDAKGPVEIVSSAVNSARSGGVANTIDRKLEFDSKGTVLGETNKFLTKHTLWRAARWTGIGLRFGWREGTGAVKSFWNWLSK